MVNRFVKDKGVLKAVTTSPYKKVPTLTTIEPDSPLYKRGMTQLAGKIETPTDIVTTENGEPKKTVYQEMMEMK